MSEQQKAKHITTHVLQSYKREGKLISMLTAYDYSMARIFDEAGMDVLLVGDSASNVMVGNDTTLPLTLDQMIFMACSVKNAAKRALVVVDLPFGAYEGGEKDGFHAAVRILKEAGAHAVKLEGGTERVAIIRKLTMAGIPVMGHLGLTPQSIHQFGSYAVRAREEMEAQKLMEDAKAIEKAGCFAVVLEKIPAALAGKVSEALHIPTIGIGAGNKVDGQVLVMHDMLGINKDFKPKFLRRYADLYEEIKKAAKNYIEDVKTRDFPNEKEQY